MSDANKRSNRAEKCMLWPIALLSAACGCASQAQPRAPAKLTVAAAASLQFAASDLADAFRQEAGVAVEFTFGSTGVLARQIAEGAPFDVFMAADMTSVDDLAAKRLTDGSGYFATGRLVIWQPDNAPTRVYSLADLASPAIRRVAIANPATAPYGAAAMQVLRAAGIEAVLKPKLVPGNDVAQALRYAQTGDVDAAIVAASLATDAPGRSVPVDAALHAPIRHGVAVIRHTHAPSEARRFVWFLGRDRAQAILAKHGFGPPDAPASAP